MSLEFEGKERLIQRIDNAIESVQHGKGLSPPLKDSNLFPAQLLEMIAVAEESNQLEKVLLKIADTEVNATARNSYIWHARDILNAER